MRERNISAWLPLTRSPLETWPLTQAYALDWELNLLPFDSQIGTQPLSHASQGPFVVFLQFCSLWFATFFFLLKFFFFLLLFKYSYLHLLFKFYFKPHVILFLTPFCHRPSLYYLHLKFYFLPFFALFLFPTLNISTPSSCSKSFSSPLVISYYHFPILQYS